MDSASGDGTSEVFDFQSFFERTGSDEGLAKELIDLLLRDLPNLVGGVGKAAQARDAKQLERSAHALKGAVANFSATASVKAAERLETMGRQGSFEDVESRYQHLQREIERFKVALSQTRIGA